MSSTRARRITWSSAITASSTLVAAAVVLVAGAHGATAAPSPVEPATSAVTADGLPTVQIDGVVWSQAVVGNVVYAGGKFNNARPAGAAPGTNLTPRANLLAYDITTGELITSFAPDLNAQVRSVAASPDGSRVYVAGDFTTANGQQRRRVAAYSTSDGALIGSFAPTVNSAATAVVATNTTVYVGGSFAGSGSTLRGNLAAFRASDGALLGWDPNADYIVGALALSTDGSAVIAGGQFQNVGGAPAYGLAKIDAVTGSLLAWNAANTVRNAGDSAGINSLRVDGNDVYGTTWHFGPGGNLEGAFRADVDSGDVNWVVDCHGDTYSSFSNGGIVYVVGHAHYCGNVGGGFPQTSPWSYQQSQAFTTEATGTHLQEVYGYPNWGGFPSPSIVSWTPDLAVGSFTGIYQAGWSLDGNDDYLVVGGEFPRVNGVAQQGLVRFAKKPIAPAKQGPKVANPFVPTLVATSPTSVRVSWLAGYDRDDYDLTYKVIRNNAFGSPAYTTSASSNWWTLPALGFVDTGLTPGGTYTYVLVANDSSGNVVYGSRRSITLPATVPQTTYATQVVQDGASIFWPLNEPSGPTVVDRAGVTDAVADTGLTRGVPGAISGDTASRFNGNSLSRVYSSGTSMAPDEFTIQAWINSTTTAGGRILGFSDVKTGNSGHRDRQIYMGNSGRIWFGVRDESGARQTVSSAQTYRDGAWHQVTATFGSSGMKLFVDGVRVGQRSDTTDAENYLGYWRLGGDNMASWAGAPSNVNFTGDIDEVAIYPTALTQSTILAQYTASGRTATVPPRPADQYGAAVYDDEPDLYWRLGESSGSTAADSGASLNNGTYFGGNTKGQPGALSGVSNTAVSFNGINGMASSDAQFSNPSVYSLETWFKTSTVVGGKLIGFGNNRTGQSNSYDRHVYMQKDGKLVFGVWTGQTNTITTPASYNDGQWHHVVATQSSAGMKLYVDGVSVGTNPQTASQSYNGYWKVGGDRTWGSTSDYFAGTLDEAAVYPTALTPQRVAEHFMLAGGAIANQAPTAAFTSSTDDLAVSVDGSGSSDPDGTVESYAWDFGDGATDTGATASHTYAAAGTYQVTLTVTDDDGATDAETKDVTVTAPPVNQAPTAAFTSSTDDLAVSVDGSGSSDPDGTVESYAWDFGDGATDTGATASHTYAAAGTYQVTLTVTDDDGATDAETKDVTVTAAATPVVVASDEFARTQASGFGSADTGGSWTLTGGASNFAVTGGAGTIQMGTAGSGPAAYLNAVSARDVEAVVDMAIDKPPTGGGYYGSFLVRRIGRSDYRLKLRLRPTVVRLEIARVVDGTESVLSSERVAGLTYQPGDDLRLRFRVTGAGTTTLSGKVWKVGSAEPDAWTTTASDAEASLQSPGAVGLRTYLSGSATNAPVVASIDNLNVVTVP